MSKSDAKTRLGTKSFEPNESVDWLLFHLRLPVFTSGKKDKLVLGRANSHTPPDIDLSGYGEASQWVSREHLYIYTREHLFMVSNGATYPTYHNGFEVKRSDSGKYQMEELNNGDELRIGKVDIIVYFVDVDDLPEGKPLLDLLTSENADDSIAEMVETPNQTSYEPNPRDGDTLNSGGGTSTVYPSDETDPKWAVTPERLARVQQVAEKIDAKRQALITATPLCPSTGERGVFVGWEYDGGFRPVYQTPGGIKFLVPLYPYYDSPFVNSLDERSNEER